MPPLVRNHQALGNFLVVAAAVFCYLFLSGCATPTPKFYVSGRGVNDKDAAADLIAERANATLARLYPNLSEPPKLIKVVPPTMSRAAMVGDFRGTVVAQISVAADGHVEAVKIVESPSSVLSDSACATLAQWVFRPLVEDGVAKPFKVRQTFSYRIGP